MGILQKVTQWLEIQNARDDMDHHCEHQPVGSCSDACAAQVMADRW